ncbi:hypothetical protein [Streptomyces zhihengii]
MPRISRIRRGLLATAATVTATTAMAAISAPPGPVYSGAGWIAELDQPIRSIHPGGYEIVFADHRARIFARPYFSRAAAQITVLTGIPVTLTTKIDTTPVGTCPARHRIIVTMEHQPMGLPGYSQARPCWDSRDNSAWGGHIRMDSEYWDGPWFGPDWDVNQQYRRNISAHELGHILGLDHPNADLNRDGAVDKFECVRNEDGWTPLMCSPNGGYRTDVGSGTFTEFDAAGLKQMADNYWLRQQ